jgi:hypothetical protein
MTHAQRLIGARPVQRAFDGGTATEPRKEYDMTPVTTPEAQLGFYARLVEVLAATDRFVTWWGAHRAWPANEPPRIGRAR